jgi:hypothetical protein
VRLQLQPASFGAFPSILARPLHQYRSGKVAFQNGNFPMLMQVKISLVVLCISAALAVPVSAGGWSGGDSSPLRIGAAQGHTLGKIWSRINDR